MKIILQSTQQQQQPQQIQPQQQQGQSLQYPLAQQPVPSQTVVPFENSSNINPLITPTTTATSSDFTKFDGLSSLSLKSSVVQTFMSLDEQDLNIWEDGYRNFLQTENYWDDFKKEVFGNAGIDFNANGTGDDQQLN
ncbi:unnamed protein product [Ambrosiozyma monospora]|uniref:Unnamed protein product n=1 Tax=Ambrosiozyma monospora TaxID=43982 RepID=A0ACB5SXR6_AMBMO|nr:unnamed protein product [Ambrosiozyma monospora]